MLNIKDFLNEQDKNEITNLTYDLELLEVKQSKFYFVKI